MKSTISATLILLLYPMNSSIMVTKFKTLLKADSYQLAPEKVALVDTHERMRRYVQDRKKEMKSLFSFPYTEGRALLVVEQRKGGEIKLLNFRYF